MKRIRLFPGIGLIIFSFAWAFAGQAGKTPLPVVIESINITPAPASEGGCTLQWSAVVRNRGSAAQKDLVIQGLQLDTGGHEQPASGARLGTLSAGATMSTWPLHFVRWEYATQLRVGLWQKDRWIAQRTIDLPPEPECKLALENFHSTNTSYEVTVRNLLSNAVGGITIQAYACGDPPPPEKYWPGAGGESIKCLPGRGTYLRFGYHKQKDSFLRIELSRADTIILKRIYKLH